MTWVCELEPLEPRELLSSQGLLVQPEVRASTTGPRIGLERQDNLLLWYGQPVRLLGYGGYGLMAEGVFNHNVFFENMAAYGANLVRIWVNYHWTNELTPFVKTQGGSNPRYRL